MQLLSNDQVMSRLAQQYEELRLSRQLRDADVMSIGGVSKDALYKFKRGGNISLANFIKIARGLGVLDRLDKLLIAPNEIPSPTTSKKEIKRVRVTQVHPDDDPWGESH